jgi:hypothetical protein
MANYDEQIVRLWDEWEDTTGAAYGDPNDFLDWALDAGRLQPSRQDVKKTPSPTCDFGTSTQPAI